MFFGYNTNGFADHRLNDTIEILGECGYRGLALTIDYHTIDPFINGWEYRAEKIRDWLRQERMRVVVETGARFILDPRRKHFPTLIDADRHRANERLRFIEMCIDIADILDADCVSFWSGINKDTDTPEKAVLARLVEQCTRLCDYADSRRIRLAFEPEPGMFIDTMEKFQELHGLVKRRNFGLTMDIGHLHCQGETPISDHIHAWQHWLWNIHIEDMKKGVHEHLPFGQGEVDFKDVFEGLQEIDYQRGLYVELSRHSHAAVEMARQSMNFLSQYTPQR